MLLSFQNAVFFLAFVETVLCLGHNDGWIPLTEDEGLRKFIGGPTRRSSIDHHFRNPKYDPEPKTQKDNAIKLVTPQHVFQIGKESVFNSLESRKQYESEDLYYQQDGLNRNDNISFVPSQANSNNLNTEKEILELKRQPKALYKTNIKNIDDKAIISNENIPLRSLGINFLKEPTIQDIAMERKYNTYEVSEDSSDELKQKLDTKETISYTFKPPAITAKLTDLNITNTLVNTLSKYNIRLEDDLPNYSLSRQNSGQKPHFMFIPIPLKNPPQFNSLNHIPVDPLLAVFLSNYGYYLPGSFGIQSKYRNLYGYLASNNIHNNKPFGSYKIFSDTDSSY